MSTATITAAEINKLRQQTGAGMMDCRKALTESNGEFVSAYIHGAYRMGVLVGLNKNAGEAGKDIAMQIAAMNPIAIDQNSVPAEVIAREKDIAIEQVKAEGKPAEMAEKIAMGKINK